MRRAQRGQRASRQHFSLPPWGSFSLFSFLRAQKRASGAGSYYALCNSIWLYTQIFSLSLFRSYIRSACEQKECPLYVYCCSQMPETCPLVGAPLATLEPFALLRGTWCGRRCHLGAFQPPRRAGPWAGHGTRRRRLFTIPPLRNKATQEVRSPTCSCLRRLNLFQSNSLANTHGLKSNAAWKNIPTPNFVLAQQDFCYNSLPSPDARAFSSPRVWQISSRIKKGKVKCVSVKRWKGAIKEL